MDNDMITRRHIITIFASITHLKNAFSQFISWLTFNVLSDSLTPRLSGARLWRIRWRRLLEQSGA